MTDDELYEKYYKEAVRDLGRQYGFNTANPKIDVKKKAEDKVAKDAKDNMVDFAKGKDTNDKIQALDEAIQDIGLIVGATAKGAQNTRNARNQQSAAKFREMQKAMEKTGNGEMRVAAGAEDMAPKAILDTKNLTLEQKNNLMHGFAEAETKLGSKGFELDPSTDVSKFKDRKDFTKKRNKKAGDSMLRSTAQKHADAQKAGYETRYEHERAGHKAYEEYRNKPETYIEKEQPRDTKVLDESVKLENGDIIEKTPEQRSLKNEERAGQRRMEKASMEKIGKFMNLMNEKNPRQANILKRIIIENNGDIHLRDSGNKVLSKAMEDTILGQLTGESKNNAPLKRIPSQITSRKGPIERMVLNEMSEPEIYQTGEKFLGRENVFNLIDKFGPEIAKKKIASGIGLMVASMMYSEENNDKTINQIVKGNAEQLSGKNAKAWANEGNKIWDNWLKTFDAESMDNEDDYKTFLEAEQLLNDYKKGNKIMSKSGNTNPMAELMTDPRFVKMLMKYNPDDASRLLK